MQDVYYESTAFGDVLVDENGDPLAIIFDTSGGGSETGPVAWKESVEAVADLPPDDNVLGDARLVRAERRIYMWSGSDWQVLEDTVGGGGGLSGVWKDPVQDVEDLPLVDNALDDIRLVRSEFLLYVWTGTAWEIIGLPWDNDGGGGGEPVDIRWKDSVATFNDLPTLDNVLGDARLVLDVLRIYAWNGSEWELVGDIGTGGGAPQLNLNDELKWLEVNNTTSAGSFQVRAQTLNEYHDMETDPGFASRGPGGMLYYPPDENGPGAYEPNRNITSGWSTANRIGRRDDTVLLKEKWDVDIWGSIEGDYVFDGLYELMITAGTDDYPGYTLCGVIDRANNLLRFGRLDPWNTMSYTGLESVAFPSPPAGSDFYLWMYRDGDVITLYGEVTPPEGDYYWVEIMHVIDETTDWMDPAGGLHPGFLSQWGTTAYGHSYQGMSVVAADAWRELVLKLRSAGAGAPEVDLIMADTRTGWLLGEEPDGPPHKIVHTAQDGTSSLLPQREYLRFVDGYIVGLYVSDNDPHTDVHATIDLNKLEDETKKTLKKERGETTPFIALVMESGYSQPQLEDDPAVAGPRYKLSYQFDNGWINFRGFFEAAAAGSGKIGAIGEGFRPPHTVRGTGVREDGTVVSARVEPNGDVFYENAQVGRNHMDGFRYYIGLGPVEVEGTFIPDPDDPYKAYRSSHTTFVLDGSGIFEHPRGSDEGIMYQPPLPDVPPGEGWDGWYWSYDPNAYFTWVVIDGPDVGQSGTVYLGTEGVPRFESVSDTEGWYVTIPAGLDGTVRVTFHNMAWELGYIV